MLKLPSISIGLRQLKNSLVPINRLPPEILALVSAFRESEEDLMSATAVCKYWRSTLVSTPNLWNNIVCGRDVAIPLVHMYFERSRTVPVVVQIHARSSRLLSPHTERISGLTMFIENLQDLHDIAEHLSKPAPLLHTITLRFAHRDRHSLTLPPGFFEVFLSSTKALTLHGRVLSPGPCELSRLTKFTLESDLSSATSADLLDSLEQIPLLQVFKALLRRRGQLDRVPGDRVVTLPRLEEISITIDENLFRPVASPILPSLRLPSARNVFLQSIGACGAPLTPILPLSFEDRLPSLNVVPKASVALNKEKNGTVFYGLGDSTFTLCTNSDTPYAFTLPTFGGLPFNSVRRLRVSFRSSTVDTSFFVNILRSMKGLECLKLKQNTVGPLGCWIGLDDQAGICPALSTLTIIDADFHTAKGCVEVLEQVRNRAGVPIANVEIMRDGN